MKAGRSRSDYAAWLLKKHERFVPFIVESLTGDAFISTRYDAILSETLDRTFKGEIKRLIINIPPGYGKTLRVVWAYVSRGLAINPAAQFIHTSYSDELVRDNSSKIRDIVDSEDFQSLYPYVSLKADTNSKRLWRTVHGGGVLSSPSGGSITGFRAGVITQPGFTGAFIIDDPMKPDDAQSETRRAFINSRWDRVFKSRLAREDVPVIVIMQRLHDDDFTSHLLASGDWHHLVLPVHIRDNYVYTQPGHYIEHGLAGGALWPERKHTQSQALDLMGDVQYSQEPSEQAGDVFEKEWFQLYDELPEIKRHMIYCDTASKIKKHNDYTVFQHWGQGFDNHLYLIDQYRKKTLIPYLKEDLNKFREGTTASLHIEDKDSGVGLIQSLRIDGAVVHAIGRREGKYSRMTKAAPRVKEGLVHLPKNKTMTHSIISEAVAFKADDTHAYDDQIDPMADAINEVLNKKAGYAIGNNRLC